ncbi:MAG: hypothetical protein AAFO07_30285 [Bacteroidota bacterium]
MLTLSELNMSIKSLFFLTPFAFLLACQNSTLENLGLHYQQNQDYQSLNEVVNQIELGVDKMYIKKILGEPIDMGFDYRYLIDSVGPNGCVIGAVFHINEDGKIDQKWIDEICE